MGTLPKASECDQLYKGGGTGSVQGWGHRLVRRPSAAGHKCSVVVQHFWSYAGIRHVLSGTSGV